MPSELISINKQLYDKMEAMKLGGRDSFTKVISYMFSEIERLKKDNEQLSKDLIKSIHEIEQLEKKR